MRFSVFSLAIWFAASVSAVDLTHAYHDLMYYESYRMDYESNKDTKNRLIAASLDDSIKDRPANFREFMVGIRRPGDSFTADQIAVLESLGDNPDPDDAAKKMNDAGITEMGHRPDPEKVIAGMPSEGNAFQKLGTMVDNVSKRTKEITSAGKFDTGRFDRVKVCVDTIVDYRALDQTFTLKEWYEKLPDSEKAGVKLVFKPPAAGRAHWDKTEILDLQNSEFPGKGDAKAAARKEFFAKFSDKNNKNKNHNTLLEKFREADNWMNPRSCT